LREVFRARTVAVPARKIPGKSRERSVSAFIPGISRNENFRKIIPGIAGLKKEELKIQLVCRVRWMR
jgi:hypothetical protein